MNLRVSSARLEGAKFGLPLSFIPPICGFFLAYLLIGSLSALMYVLVTCWGAAAREVLLYAALFVDCQVSSTFTGYRLSYRGKSRKFLDRRRSTVTNECIECQQVLTWQRFAVLRYLFFLCR